MAEWYCSGSVYVGQQCFGTLWQETANTARFVANPNQLVRKYVTLTVAKLPKKDKLNTCLSKRHIFFYVENCRKALWLICELSQEQRAAQFFVLFFLASVPIIIIIFK